MKILLLSLLLFLGAHTPEKPVRILYWNIQNGMWADQGNHYDNFVAFVKETAPDICIWCEAKTHYHTHSGEAFAAESDSLYLPAHWSELAARYGHQYVFTGGERDFFPQVITSRYPLQEILRMTGDDSVVVSHGAGWATVDIDGKKLNIVTVHTWPQKYGFNVPKVPANLRAESARRHDGDTCRMREMQWVVEHTIGTNPEAEKQWWIVAGDMNSISRVDNAIYRLAEDSPEFLTQDYLMGLPFLKDAGHYFLNEFIPTGGKRRIDYIYCTPPVLDAIRRLEVMQEGYPARKKTDIRNFWIPSDHLPILVELIFPH